MHGKYLVVSPSRSLLSECTCLTRRPAPFSCEAENGRRMKACGTPGACRSLTTRQLFSLGPMHSGSVENESCDLFLAVLNHVIVTCTTSPPSPSKPIIRVLLENSPVYKFLSHKKFSVVVDSRNNISNPSQRYYLEKHSMVTHSCAISFRRVPRSIFDSYSIPAFTVCEVLRAN